jgi:hypothetical protein
VKVNLYVHTRRLVLSAVCGLTVHSRKKFRKTSGMIQSPDKINMDNQEGRRRRVGDVFPE